MKRNKVRIETILQVPEGVIVWVQAEAIQAAAVIQVAAEVSGEAELREAGRKRRVFRRGVSEMSSSPRIKKALQNFYSAFHNKAACLQPEASGLFLAGTSKNAVFRMPYRYITEYL